MKQLFFFLMISVGALAKAVDGYVYDMNNNPLENVEVRNVKSGKVVFSNRTGFFSVEGDDRDTILFTLAEYVTNGLTIRNIKNSNGKVFLFNELIFELPEVTVTPDHNMYKLYEKAIYNLKSRLIKNKTISYECTHFEKEINSGDERGLNILFTAMLNTVNPRQKKVNYKFFLSKLEITPATQTSEIMKDNKLYEPNLFFEYINNKMSKSKGNSIQISDSIIVIKNGDDDNTVVYTIDKADTTLIKVEYAVKSDPRYRQFRTFKVKQVYYSFSAEFRKEMEGYCLYELVVNEDFSFLTGKPEKEERIIGSYKISTLPYTIQDASLNIELDTRILYNMGNYPALPD
ncbi:MAG: hypothetical protein LBL57_07345 [Tannerella sp.]|nr:hypothetical protein [Tannerella sp.]